MPRSLSINCCSCCFRTVWTPEEIEQNERSREIDKELERERQRQRRQVKLLLLGAGESGKSTFLKQMRIIHGHSFSRDEREDFQVMIYRNILMGMKVLVDARNKLRITWGDASRDSYGQHVMNFSLKMTLDWSVFNDYVNSVRELWQDTGIREAYARRAEYQLTDSVAYFFDSLDRIARDDYMPTDRDILHARKATKSVTEFTIPIQNVPFMFVDVGGQRTERQRWIQCFDGVTSIIFLASSSEFDQKIVEDRVTNRVEESLNIFQVIANHKTFCSVSIILFLNKTDLLIEKVKSRQSDISVHFPDFTGNPFNVSDVQQFILQKFWGKLRSDNRRTMFHHFTTAVDTENIKIVFNAVKDIILQKNIESLMLQ